MNAKLDTDVEVNTDAEGDPGESSASDKATNNTNSKPTMYETNSNTDDKVDISGLVG